jgi:membrane protease subunit HflK
MDWTPPPRGTGGQQQPDLGKVVSDIRSKLPSFKKAKGLWVVVLIVLALIVGSSAFYTVEPEETAVVLRFGKFVRESGPGLHFKLPFGVESATKVKTQRVYIEEFGFRGAQPGLRSRSTDRGYSEEALMLTGDLNVVDMKWIVQFKISDPQKWLFAVRDGVAAIRDLSQATMRSIVGNRNSDTVVTEFRAEIETLAQVELQKLLDSYNTGVVVDTVNLQDVLPPKPVLPAFNEVNEARQQKERMINEAEEAYNREIPKAKGNAKRVVTEAEGYMAERVNRASGEALRFDQVLTAYRKAKDVTKRRFYLETMKKVLENAGKVYVVDEQVKGLLPFMDLTRGRGPAKKEVQQ